MADRSGIQNPNGLPEPVTRQISTTAKYYPPGVYTGAGAGSDLPSLLSFYRDLSITSDPAAAGFIPMSAVPSRGRNTKLFAIGILPPSMTIDESQLLDRSAVAPNLTGDSATADRIASITTADTEELIIPRQISSVGVGAIKKFEGNSLTAYPDAGGFSIGVGHHSASVTKDLVWTQEQVDAQFAIDVGVAEDAVKHNISVPVTQGQFDALVSLAYNIGGGKFASSTVVAKLNANDRDGASEAFMAFDKVTVDGVKVVSQSQVSRRTIERQIFDRPSLAPANPVPVKADTDSAYFAGYGSQNANSFRRGLARQTDLIQTDLLNTQRSYLLAIKRSLQAMINTPPLRLLVNPNSFGVKSQKIVNDGNWGRNGPIIEFWGDDQDKISGAGKVAGFYALDARPQLGRGGPGLTRHARNLSLSWQNLQSLYLLYRNNGGMYLQDMSRQDRDILLTTVGSVYLFYDNILYIGCFDSFTLTEAQDQPFSVEYSFEFTVRAAFLLEFAQDFNYGGSPAFSKSTLGSGLPTQSSNSPTSAISTIAAQGSSFVGSEDIQGTIDSAADAIVQGGGSLF